MSELMSLFEMIDETKREREAASQKYTAYWMNHAVELFNDARRIPLTIRMSYSFMHHTSHCRAETLQYVRDALAKALLEKCWDVEVVVVPETWWSGPKLVVSGRGGRTFSARETVKP